MSLLFKDFNCSKSSDVFFCQAAVLALRLQKCQELRLRHEEAGSPAAPVVLQREAAASRRQQDCSLQDQDSFSVR